MELGWVEVAKYNPRVFQSLLTTTDKYVLAEFVPNLLDVEIVMLDADQLKMTFSGSISTCNVVVEDTVTIDADRPVLWSQELNSSCVLEILSSLP